MNKILVLVLLVLSVKPLRAQQRPEQFNIPVNYLLYLPQDYSKDTAKQWPLMVFLHGSGESGTDLEKVKVHGPAKLIEKGRQYPFIVVSPQAPPGEGWEPQVIIRLVKGLQSKYKVDRDRIYLTGLSMGGFGTWATAIKFPNMFAAIAPICGGGDTAEVAKLKTMPVWCFHGAKDKVVPTEESYRMVNALRKVNNNVKLTIYPDAEHDSWTATYNNDSLYTWMLAQKRFHFPRVKLSDKQLNEYVGAYLQKGKDTLHIILKEGKLILQEDQGIEFVPTQNNSFFIEENDREMEIKFKRDETGKIIKMLLMVDTILEFEKTK